jgi:hypothetical protein
MDSHRQIDCASYQYVHLDHPVHPDGALPEQPARRLCRRG